MLLSLVVFFAWHAQNFRLDASADSLLLENDPDLKEAFEIWKEREPEKAGNPYEVLGFIYSRSSYQEKEFQRYPIARIP